MCDCYLYLNCNLLFGDMIKVLWLIAINNRVLWCAISVFSETRIAPTCHYVTLHVHCSRELFPIPCMHIISMHDLCQKTHHSPATALGLSEAALGETPCTFCQIISWHFKWLEIVPVSAATSTCTFTLTTDSMFATHGLPKEFIGQGTKLNRL